MVRSSEVWQAGTKKSVSVALKGREKMFICEHGVETASTRKYYVFKTPLSQEGKASDALKNTS